MNFKLTSLFCVSALSCVGCLQAISYYPWNNIYEMWMPPTLKEQVVSHRIEDGYPFDAPAEVLSTQSYNAINIELDPKAALLGDLSFFEAPMLPQGDVLNVRLANIPTFSLTPDPSLMADVHFPLEGAVKVDEFGEFYLYWQVYVPLSAPLNRWVKGQIAQCLKENPLPQGTYDIEIFIP